MADFLPAADQAEVSVGVVIAKDTGATAVRLQIKSGDGTVLFASDDARELASRLWQAATRAEDPFLTEEPPEGEESPGDTK